MDVGKAGEVKVNLGIDLPSYPEYKYVNLGYLEKVPLHWDYSKVSYLFHVVNGSTPSSSMPEYWDGDIVWVTPEDLGKLTEVIIASSSKKLDYQWLCKLRCDLVSKGKSSLINQSPDWSPCNIWS